MILLLFFLTADSLPPLPDISQIVFPEPPLWLEEKEQSITVAGYAGDFYGGKCDVLLQNFSTSLSYDKRIDWDSVESAKLTASYSLPLPHFWLKPSIHGCLLQRNNEYYLLTPELDFSSTVPWAIFFGNIHADLWDINEVYHAEEAAKLGIIFDRAAYLPHFEIAGVYTDRKLKSDLTGKLHIRNLHIAISSPISYSFPSPTFVIQYLDLNVKADIGIKSGVMYRALTDYFDPEMPLNYRIPVLDESLRIKVNLNLELDLENHCWGIYCSYKNWFDRLVVGNDFQMTTTQDIQEVNIVFNATNSFAFQNVELNNTFSILYNWVDNSIPFLPQYAIYDTLNITYGFMDLILDLRYLHERDGIRSKLPAVVVINPTVGLKYKFMRIFLSTNNAGGQNKEIFDNYFLNNRQFAGGLELSFRL